MKSKNELEAYGIKVLLPENEAVTTLEKEYVPANYGHQVWDASWLLIDYLSQSNEFYGLNIMDIGCGWGLAGIYCAKVLNASVISVDVDENVQPFLDLMASINGVQVDFLNAGFHQLEGDLLNRADIVIGSDICFCEPLISPLKDLITRLEKSSVKQVILSDPGRWTFTELAESYTGDDHFEYLDRGISSPVEISGKILNARFPMA